jgi:hypothetical protein
MKKAHQVLIGQFNWPIRFRDEFFRFFRHLCHRCEPFQIMNFQHYLFFMAALSLLLTLDEKKSSWIVIGWEMSQSDFEVIFFLYSPHSRWGCHTQLTENFRRYRFTAITSDLSVTLNEKQRIRFWLVIETDQSDVQCVSATVNVKGQRSNKAKRV